MRALLVLLLLLAAPVFGANAPDDVLVDQNGRPVPASSLSGHYLLVYFGYTSCPDICPTALLTMSRTLELLGTGAQDLRALFVTVDPEHDSVDVMRKYVAHFDKRILGLTGSASAVAAAERAFRATAHRSSASAAMDHSPFLYFAGPDGKVLQTFHATQSAEEIASQMRTRLPGSRT
jgi:protein SCO1/2